VMYRLLRALLFRLDPELAHELALGGLRAIRPILKLLASRRASEGKIRAFGMDFPDHMGLAAGMDKDGLLGSLWAAFGFGFVEVGTITPRPQPGNPKPRLFRIPEREAIINRMGFNSAGVEVVRRNLLRDPKVVPVGINAGKNRDTPNDQAHEDYLHVIGRLYDLGDYFVINVSSPNTVGLRDLQRGDNLRRLLGEIYRWRRGRPRKPFLLKLAPEIEGEALQEVARMCEMNDIDGVILTNTLKVEGGGLSGRPLFGISTERISQWRSLSDIPVIGVGGIFSRADSLEKLRRGATLTQVLTGFVYRGWEIFR